MFYKKVYYEKETLKYPLGKKLQDCFSTLEWIPIESHNNIEVLRKLPNKDFSLLKHYLILGIRKTHVYKENHKVSDYLVPFTSSGCSAMCLYCYLVCNYNTCSYLRLYTNVEEIFTKLIKKSQKTEKICTFEIGSNSDLLLENKITGNLEAIIEKFGKEGRGFITFPTKFHEVDTLLSLQHFGKTIFRMSLNPEFIITKVELGTSPLMKRIDAINQMASAGYPVGILIAPVIFVQNWKEIYHELFLILADKLSPKVKENTFIEVIFMTYSYVHKAIHEQAFPHALKLYNKELMTGRGRGKYWYKEAYRKEAEVWIRNEIASILNTIPILYVV